MPSPFISVQDLEDLLGRPVVGDPGGTIAVDAACDICRTVAEQTLDQVVGGTAVLDGTGTDCLLLPELPVTRAGTVTVNGTAITDYTLNDKGMLFRGTVGVSSSYWSDELPAKLVWPAGRQNVRVTYDHGYASADLPRSVRMVALQVASRLLVQGVAIQETQGDASVRYAVSATDLTAGERLILRKFKER